MTKATEEMMKTFRGEMRKNQTVSPHVVWRRSGGPKELRKLSTLGSLMTDRNKNSSVGRCQIPHSTAP